MEPINPQDHAVRNFNDGWDRDLKEIATPSGLNDGIDFFGGAMWREALVEAIHQTFERDYLPRICTNCGNEYRTGFSDENGEGLGGACCQIPHKCDGKNCTMALGECDHHYAADPDTEIDRTARLIVDGEYRRRSESSNPEGEANG